MKSTPEPSHIFPFADSNPFGGLLAGIEARVSMNVPDERYEAFKAKYFFDPVGFADDCIDWASAGDDERQSEDAQSADGGDNKSPLSAKALAFYQREIMEELLEHGRECARGPRGLGKSATSAILILWFALTRDGMDWKIPTTAGSWRQLSKYLWPEIHKWARKLKWDVIGRKPFNARTELMTLSLKLSTGEAFSVASDVPELIEGAHADHLLFVYDESKSIPAATFDASEGAFSNAPSGKRRNRSRTAKEALALAVSTPGEDSGRFHEIQSGSPGFEDWHTKRVTLADVIQAGMLTASWAEQRRLQWGEDSQMYRNHVLGEFASNDSQGFIPLSWVEMAQERFAEWQEANKAMDTVIGIHSSVGVDVGDESDKSVFALKNRIEPNLEYTDSTGKKRVLTVKGGIYELRESRERGIMPIAGETKNILDARGGKAVIDKNGIGAGALGRLREQGLGGVVVPFNSSESPPPGARDKTGELKFKDKRSWAFSMMRDLLNPVNGENFMLPPHKELASDLTAPRAEPLNSNGELKIESKKEIRKRIHRSTDYGDAACMALVADAVGRQQAKKVRSSSYSSML